MAAEGTSGSGKLARFIYIGKKPIEAPINIYIYTYIY